MNDLVLSEIESTLSTDFVLLKLHGVKLSWSGTQE